MAIMLAAQLGPAAMQFFQGVKQKKEGEALAKTVKDPVFDIPDSAEAALANAERNASSRYMPGQTNLQTSLNQNTANVTSDILRTARSPQDALAALTAVNATNQKGQNEIGFQAAQNFNQRQADLRGQQGIMSQWENKKWENDVLNRFLRDSAAASALKNAGIQNKYQGAKAAFGAVGSAAGPGGGMDLSRLFGGGAPEAMGSNPSGAALSIPQQGGLAPTTAPNLFSSPQFAGQPTPQSLGMSPEQFSALQTFFKMQ